MVRNIETSHDLDIAFTRSKEGAAVLSLQNVSSLLIAYKVTVTFVRIQRPLGFQRPLGVLMPLQSACLQMSTRAIGECLCKNSQSYVSVAWDLLPAGTDPNSVFPQTLPVGNSSRLVRIPLSALFSHKAGEQVPFTPGLEVSLYVQRQHLNHVPMSLQRPQPHVVFIAALKEQTGIYVIRVCLAM